MGRFGSRVGGVDDDIKPGADAIALYGGDVVTSVVALYADDRIAAPDFGVSQAVTVAEAANDVKPENFGDKADHRLGIAEQANAVRCAEAMRSGLPAGSDNFHCTRSDQNVTVGRVTTGRRGAAPNSLPMYCTRSSA